MFRDRADAGAQLAARVLANRLEHAVVLALPRGGVPVARQVAAGLQAPLDVLIVRKLGVPWHPEYAFGALGEGGVVVIDERIISELRIDRSAVEQVVAAETAEIHRRVQQYRAGRSPESVAGRTVVLVDDGLATGSTMVAAVKVVRKLAAARVIVAVPVASEEAVRRIALLVDGVVCLRTPADFHAVGQHYVNFNQVPDSEVVQALAEYRDQVAGRGRNQGLVVEPSLSDDHHEDEVDAEVIIPADGVLLHGHLAIPKAAKGIVVFAHGSGSSRNSPRNQYVAGALNDAGLGTLLFDLLTDREAADRSKVFDIDLLARRLAGAIGWLTEQPTARGKSIGLFGASTGAAAAFVAAANLPDVVASVVSRGGRPDLAGRMLRQVTAPTLLIVGDHDYQVIELNRAASREIAGSNRLVLVPGATHLFEEPGTLEQVAELAERHFSETLTH